MKRFIFLVFIISTNLCIGQNLWTTYSESQNQKDGEGKDIFPINYQALTLDVHRLHQLIEKKSAEEFLIAVPTPDGAFVEMKFVESSIMEKSLQIQFPEIRTFKAKALDNPNVFGTFDLTPHGFHGMVKTSSGTYFIDPFSRLDRTHYLVYNKNAFPSNYKNMQCSVSNETISHGTHTLPQVESRGTLTCNTNVLKRTYRLAVSCTGEYAAFHGGTVADALAAITTTINRVNQVYEIDFATTLILIANETDIIYTNASTDPYNNSNAGVLIGQSQSNITNVIGSANFDIGHTFSTGAGGLAGLGVICQNSDKASGVTGTSSPVGDPYDIDYVAHEIGHQFGSNHTFNGSTGSCSGGNRNGSTAYEPGSGTTIMAYAGICSPQNIQNNSDAYFHASSHNEILNYIINSTGNTCGTSASVGNTSPQIISYTTGYTIPKSTPFYLEGSATDPDGDALTYCWEEYDLGPAGAPNSAASSTSQPAFRSFSPTSSGIRLFPQLSDILNNSQTIGEILSTVGRNYVFRLTVRDNGTNSGNSGGLCFQDNNITVSGGAGPFLITSFNTPALLIGGSTQTLTWDVANTDAAPVSCALVNILMSTDGGQTFSQTLVSNTPNDGSEDITIPSIESSQVRFKIESANNIFFDINNADMIISAMCQVFTQGTDLVIPTTVSTVTSTQDVTGMNGNITDINIIDLQGTHTYVSDLTVELEHFDGVKRTLFSGVCGSNDDFNIKFDDASSMSYGSIPCPPTDGLTYQPNQSLSTFNGLAPNGTWKLNIIDGVNQDGGILDTWTLMVCTDVALPLDLLSIGVKEISANVLQLDWLIGQANNVEQFQVYRSIDDGENFEQIGKVDYKEGQKSYHLVDKNIPSKASRLVYKLKIVDIDHSFVWSKLVPYDIKSQFQVTLSPMPFDDKLDILLNSDVKGEMKVELFSITGKLLNAYSLVAQESNSLDMSLLQSGIYFLSISTKEDTRSFKIIKE